MYTQCPYTLAYTALQVMGHERPLLVGLDPVINCSTYLSVTKLEWLLVGFDIPLESSTSQSLPLALDLTSDGLDGAMFRCRATTRSHGTYEETITIAVKGNSYITLICNHLALSNFDKSDVVTCVSLV